MSDTHDPSRPEFPEEPIDAIATPFQRFIHTEVSGGVVLLLATAAALAIANSPLAAPVEAFWNRPFGLRFGDIVWEHSLRHWINDGLVTLFFFVIGLEIKREVVHGELSAPGAAVLPFVGALGGIVVPAAVYLALASGPQAASGVGVVMATDIAFVVGCLALIGNRIPDSLRIFVLALAIIDDIAAILVIAVGYSQGFHAGPFALALLGFGATAAMQRLGVRTVAAYWAMGLLTWAALHESGVHATIAGVALGLLTPAKAWIDDVRLDQFLTWGRRAASPAGEKADREKKSVRSAVARATWENISPQQRLEDAVHPWSAFFVLPLFALANAGVAISGAGAFEPIALAVFAGLAIGKPLGIVGFAWLAVKFGIARKPGDVPWSHFLGAGMLAGIGFTMALFIANLAFEGTALESGKLGILFASLVSGTAGMAVLMAVTTKKG